MPHWHSLSKKSGEYRPVTARGTWANQCHQDNASEISFAYRVFRLEMAPNSLRKYLTLTESCRIVGRNKAGGADWLRVLNRTTLGT
jgi:hypothetical protein